MTDVKVQNPWQILVSIVDADDFNSVGNPRRGNIEGRITEPTRVTVKDSEGSLVERQIPGHTPVTVFRSPYKQWVKKSTLAYIPLHGNERIVFTSDGSATLRVGGGTRDGSPRPHLTFGNR